MLIKISFIYFQWVSENIAFLIKNSAILLLTYKVNML